jgi:ADP-heptose:LPS heptosyltransferase
MALGDVICTFPAINELKKKHPASAFIYFCREDYACLPRMAGVTDHIVSHIDIKLIETCYAFFFSAIYQFTYGDERENSASVESVIEEYCRQHGVAITAVHPRLQVRPDVLTKVNQILKNVGLTKPGPTVAIHPGPSGPFREWSNESWLAFVQALKHSGFTNIIQLGATRSDDVGKALDGKIPDVISLINQLSLEESIALISLCDLLVGIDSGLLHIAASVGTPFVGIFGATSPQLRFSSAAAQFSVVSRVVCQGCHHRIPRLHWVTGCPFDFNCMKSIQVNDVLLACRAKISLAVSGRPEK